MTLEELLNKLIEKGRVPFGRKDTEQVDEVVVGKSFYLIEEVFMEFVKYDYRGERNVAIYSCSIRELVSKESGLWQFVCENKLLPKKNGYVWNLIDHYDFDKTIKWIGEYNCLYYIIESALKNEGELEDFLLQNIKIGD